MKFSKHQKEVLKLISAGKIYDIYSYAKYYQLGHTVQYNFDEISLRFQQDNFPQKFYCAKGIRHSKNNILTKESFLSKLHNSEINPDSYICEEVHLSKSCGIKKKYGTIINMISIFMKVCIVMDICSLECSPKRPAGIAEDLAFGTNDLLSDGTH